MKWLCWLKKMLMFLCFFGGARTRIDEMRRYREIMFNIDEWSSIVSLRLGNDKVAEIKFNQMIAAAVTEYAALTRLNWRSVSDRPNTLFTEPNRTSAILFIK